MDLSDIVCVSSLFMHYFLFFSSSWSTWQASIEERGQRQNRTQSGTVYTDTVPDTGRQASSQSGADIAGTQGPRC